MQDALGRDIIIGKTYGYSNRSNGIITVVVGKVTTVSASGFVTLDIDYRGKSVYNGNIKEDTYRTRNWVSVVSNTLFPVYDPVHWKS